MEMLGNAKVSKGNDATAEWFHHRTTHEAHPESTEEKSIQCLTGLNFSKISPTICNHLMSQLKVPCDKKPAVLNPKGCPLWEVLLRKQEPLMLSLSSTMDDNGNLCASAYLSPPPQIATRQDPRSNTSFWVADFCNNLRSNWTTAHNGKGAVSCWSLGLFVLRKESTRGLRNTSNESTDVTLAHHRLFFWNFCHLLKIHLAICGYLIAKASLQVPWDANHAK